MKLLLKYSLFQFFFLWFFSVYAQAPLNDNCEQAYEIVIPNNGFAFGQFFSAKFDVSDATRQIGEKCAAELDENGNCEKTIWFKFYIPTTRNIALKLTQKDSAIPQIFAGFNVYRIKDCDYTLGDLALNLTPLNKFGVSGNSCLTGGWYLVQVACKQKAKGEVWLELNAQAQATQVYDTYSLAYDFGVVKDKTSYTSMLFNCASIESFEAAPIQDSTFNKSVFCTFTLPANSIYNSISLISFTQIKYRIFRENINDDSLKSSKPFVTLQGQSILMEDYCKNAVNRDEKYFIQFVAQDGNSIYVNANISNITFVDDLWNTPATNDVINTSNGFSRTLKHQLNCNGYLKNHGCKSVIPNKYTYKSTLYGDTTYVDYEMAGYTVIHVSEAGVLNIVSKDRYNSRLLMKYVLFKGDITQNCNLTVYATEFSNEVNLCVEPGTYTLLTASTIETAIALKTHTIKQFLNPLNTDHFVSSNPEPLGTFYPTGNQATMNSTEVNFKQSNPQTLTVDTFSMHGYLIFREFYLNSPCILGMDEVNYMSSRFNLFKGRLRTGAVHLVPNYSYRKWSSSAPMQSCQILDSGYYTVVSVMDTASKVADCVAPISKIRLLEQYVCKQDTFYYPQFAHKINNNGDIALATGNKKNLDYVFPLPLCMDCNSSFLKPTLLHFKQRFLYYNTKYSYYTFYIQHNMEFRVNLNYTSFELYAGNAISNQNVVLDSTNIVSSCDFGNVYCNLEGGRFYTLVLFNVSSYNKINAYFTPHQVSPNDYASQAYDLGHFAALGSKSSAPRPITCHTNGNNLDPYVYENGNPYILFNYNGNIDVPYKDTLNLKRDYSRKNIWYTFTVEGQADVNITLKGQTTLLKNRLFSVFQYMGAYNQNFAAVLNNGLDSSIKGMKWIISNGRNSYPESRYSDLKFTNSGCNTNRYFVLVEDDAIQSDLAHYNYILTVAYTPLNLSSAGDFCSDAVTANFTSTGTQTITANNTCHTYGNSPFELGSSETVKSTWFKIHISNLQKSDLSIQNKSGYGLRYYNVYGGNCGVMTRITHLSDVYSYFTLSCMGPGDYYIQAVCDKNTKASLKFEITVASPENSSCKPYDFDVPIAQFKIHGGCNNDTIRFENISSDGNNIEYHWYLNGKQFSTMKEPLLLIGNPNLLFAKNSLKLVVVNTQGNKRDSSLQTFEPDTTKYTFKIVGPNFVICNDTVELKVNTNYPNKINYSWIGKEYGGPYLTKTLTLTEVQSNRFYWVYGESENCKFLDSFKLNYRKSDFYRDTVLCSSEAKLTYTTYKSPWFYINGKNYTGDSFTIRSSGVYALYYNKNSCVIEETLSIEIDSTTKDILEQENLDICNQKSFDYKYNKRIISNAYWQPGDSGLQISVNKTGQYVLKGKVNSCRNLEFTLNVLLKTLSADVIQDTVVCFGTQVPLKSKFNGFETLSRFPDTDTLLAMVPFMRRITLKKDICEIKDSAWVDVFYSKNAWIDTLYCDTGRNMGITLDAGPAMRYLWLNNQQTTRYNTVATFGPITVERTYANACKDSLTVDVIKNCPFSVFIPNAFTPNVDGLNDLFMPAVGGSYRTYRLTVFNRWGELLFENENAGWNGTYQGELVQSGVYGYLVQLVDTHGKMYMYRGTFTLLY